MSTLHVAFRIDRAEYVVPAADVLHLESFAQATPIPGAAAYLAGLVQVRGRVVPVVDVRARFGLPPLPPALDRRIVVVRVGARVVALLVDSAREVVRLDPAAFAPPPELVDDPATGFVKAVASVAHRLFLLVDVPRVIGEELTS